MTETAPPAPDAGFVPEGPERNRIQARTLKVLMSSQMFGGMGMVAGYIPAALLAKDITGSAFLASLAAAMPDLMGFPQRPGEHFAGPTLFITGGRSRYVRPEHHDTIRQLFPHVQFAVIEEAGHWVQAEAPAAFLRVTSNFLDGKPIDAG